MAEPVPELDGVPTLSAREVADAIGLSYHAVLRAVHRGELAAYKLCGRVRLRKADVLAWIESSRVELEREAAQPRAITPLAPVPGSREALRALERRLGG